MQRREKALNAALQASWAWSAKNCKRPVSCAASSI
jgi:hypothetical protein